MTVPTIEPIVRPMTTCDEHTKPWAADEYILVNGNAFVYHKEKGEYWVHFYGGAKEPVSELVSRGVAVKKPANWRD